MDGRTRCTLNFYLFIVSKGLRLNFIMVEKWGTKSDTKLYLFIYSTTMYKRKLHFQKAEH
jgi:hypothetical protein